MSNQLIEPPGALSGTFLDFPLATNLDDFDAHLDWRHEVNGETEGYSSPIRCAAKMPWIDKIAMG